MLKMMKMVTIEQMHTLCDLNNKETHRCSRGVVINKNYVDAADVEDGHDLIKIYSSRRIFFSHKPLTMKLLRSTR